MIDPKLVEKLRGSVGNAESSWQAVRKEKMMRRMVLERAGDSVWGHVEIEFEDSLDLHHTVYTIRRCFVSRVEFEAAVDQVAMMRDKLGMNH